MARLTYLETTIGGEPVILRGDRSLYWPRERTLVVADVHVGKTESLRSDGVAVPDGSLFDDLVRLAAAIEESRSERLIVIGDLFHDRRGLTGAVRELLTKWRRTIPCQLDLVIGNHDRRVPVLPDEWGIVTHDPVLRRGPFAFAHDEAFAGSYSLVGHVHPAIRVSGGGDGLRVPCFHIGARVTTLPAFSSLTSGTTVGLEPGERAVACVEGFAIPLGKFEAAF